MLQENHTQELSYEFYQQRQFAEIQQDRLLHRAEKIHFGNKFRYQDGSWKMISYPGYAVLSMVNNNPNNDDLTSQLTNLQQEIIGKTHLSHKLYPLPAESFHQTIANTLSDDRYYNHIIKNGLEEKYPQFIKEAIDDINAADDEAPISMRLIGLSLFGSALGILGVFENKADFQRIVYFRNQFYHNPQLNKIGVQRTRPFIGHITLLYFGEDITSDDGKNIATLCAELNEKIKNQDLYFNIHHTQLYQYDDLAHFNIKPNFPSYSFVK